jgi:diguanylate cyclase (GGDEF)-like protein
MYMMWIDDMISVDPLTRLSNRKQLDYQYEQWQKGTDQAPAWLLMIDANKFKQINDTYGHIQGDAALVRIADALRNACSGLPRRANIARFGGDEFVVLVREDSPEQIAGLCGKIRAELKSLNEAAGSPYDLTVSIGMTKVRKGVALKDAIAEADRKLYEEKKA